MKKEIIINLDDYYKYSNLKWHVDEKIFDFLRLTEDLFHNSLHIQFISEYHQGEKLIPKLFKKHHQKLPKNSYRIKKASSFNDQEFWNHLFLERGVPTLILNSDNKINRIPSNLPGYKEMFPGTITSLDELKKIVCTEPVVRHNKESDLYNLEGTLVEFDHEKYVKKNAGKIIVDYYKEKEHRGFNEYQNAVHRGIREGKIPLRVKNGIGKTLRHNKEKGRDNYVLSNYSNDTIRLILEKVGLLECFVDTFSVIDYNNNDQSAYKKESSAFSKIAFSIENKYGGKFVSFTDNNYPDLVRANFALPKLKLYCISDEKPSKSKFIVPVRSIVKY